MLGLFEELRKEQQILKMSCFFCKTKERTTDFENVMFFL